MKKLKLVSLVMFVMAVFACQKSFAQTKQNQKQQTTNQADPNLNTQSTDTSAQNIDPGTVTIDSTAAPKDNSSTTGTTSTGNSQSTTKIHLYSGKHDGNNVINPDPKN
jgi:hypothetical protein